jgi:hypothetical protein
VGKATRDTPHIRGQHCRKSDPSIGFPQHHSSGKPAEEKAHHGEREVHLDAD